jgi:hypothetical protein
MTGAKLVLCNSGIVLAANFWKSDSVRDESNDKMVNKRKRTLDVEGGSSCIRSSKFYHVITDLDHTAGDFALYLLKTRQGQDDGPPYIFIQSSAT